MGLAVDRGGLFFADASSGQCLQGVGQVRHQIQSEAELFGAPGSGAAGQADLAGQSSTPTSLGDALGGFGGGPVGVQGGGLAGLGGCTS